MSPQPEPHPNSPQHVPQEDSFEIMVMVPAGEDTRDAQQLSPNDIHNNDNDQEEEEEQEEGNKAEGKDDEDYTPLGDAKKEETYSDTDEIKTFGDEAPIPTGRLRDLLNRIDITTPPEFKIKRVPCPGREEYKAIVEILSGPNFLSCHKGPAFKATYQDVVVDAACQVITYNRRYHDELRNTIYHLPPQRKKNKFKTSGVKADVPRLLMVHHQGVSVEMSTRLQIAQQEIQSLRD
jgi:hypothetical protein